MFCPTCKEINLVLAERQGVEIDYCPKCRGVWLDRGELDKILQRAENEAKTEARAPASSARADSEPVPPPQTTRRRIEDDHHDDDDRHHDDRPDKRRKRGGFLGELFDWD